MVKKKHDGKEIVQQISKAVTFARFFFLSNLKMISKTEEK